MLPRSRQEDTALRSWATTHTPAWAELDRQVDAVAANLAALDLPSDQHGRPRVAIALPNVPEFAAVLREMSQDFVDSTLTRSPPRGHAEGLREFLAVS